VPILLLTPRDLLKTEASGVYWRVDRSAYTILRRASTMLAPRSGR